MSNRDGTDFQEILSVDIKVLAKCLAAGRGLGVSKKEAKEFGITPATANSALGLVLRCQELKKQGLKKPASCILRTEEYLWKLCAAYEKALKEDL